MSITGNENKPAFAAPTLDNETLELRLSQGVGSGGSRGSLSRCATRYREFLAVFLSTQRDDSLADAIETCKQDLEREIGLYQVEFRKKSLSVQAMLEDVATVDKALARVDGVLDDLEKATKRLHEEQPPAKRVRHNKEEYEALAKMANSRPSRRVLIEKMETLEADKAEAETETSRSENDVSVREKQFHLLMQCMTDLKRSLAEDAASTEIDDKNSNDKSLQPSSKRTK